MASKPKTAMLRTLGLSVSKVVDTLVVLVLGLPAASVNAPVGRLMVMSPVTPAWGVSVAV